LIAPDAEGTAVGAGDGRSDGDGVGFRESPDGDAVGLAVGMLRNMLAKFT
jgi:hypothetical protein